MSSSYRRPVRRWGATTGISQTGKEVTLNVDMETTTTETRRTSNSTIVYEAIIHHAETREDQTITEKTTTSNVKTGTGDKEEDTTRHRANKVPSTMATAGTTVGEDLATRPTGEYSKKPKSVPQPHSQQRGA